jgi:hypothetical protein
MEKLVKEVSHTSDRVALTVRFASSGHREWRDASGRIALVFFEHGKWWARHSDRHDRHECSSEQEGLDYLLNDTLKELRQELYRQSMC